MYKLLCSILLNYLAKLSGAAVQDTVENGIFVLSQTKKLILPQVTYFASVNALAPGTDAMIMNMDAAVAEALEICLSARPTL